MAHKIIKKLRFWRRKSNPFTRLSRDLLEFSQAFSSITDMRQLVPSVIGKIRDLIGVDEVALFLLDRVSSRFNLTHSRGIDLNPSLRLRGNYYFEADDKLVRWLLNNRLPLVTSAMPDILDYFNEEERDILRFTSTEVCIGLEAHNRFIGLFCLGRKRDGKDFTTHDFQLLAAVSAQAALAFQNNRLQSEAIEQERMKRELEIAGTLQKRLLPSRPLLQYPQLDMAGFCIPSSEVGGDYFDYMPLSDGKLGLVIGDVSGHGMRAGLLMAMAKACLVTMTKMNTSCTQVLGTLNALIHDLAEPHMLMTFFYSELDVARRQLDFANAGHLFPYHYRKGDDSLGSLETIAYPLGVRSEYPFEEHSVSLEPGDFLVYFSDGFIEGLNGKEEQYGFERFEHSVHAHRGEDAAGLCEGVKDDFFGFLDGAAHQDDLTMMVLRVKD